MEAAGVKEPSSSATANAPTNAPTNAPENATANAAANAPTGGRPAGRDLQTLLEEVDQCQSEIDSLNEKASEEILKIEEKFNGLRRPFFLKRNDLISSIPNFWATAFVNHPQISSIMSDEEEECLHHLKKIDVEEFADIKAGFRISFTFDKNPFFSNAELVKEFHLEDAGNPISSSTSINWLAGVDLLKAQKAARERSERKRGHALHRSFFSWFMENNDPANDDIAEVIKEDLWPSPLQFYLSSDADENGTNSDDDDDVIEEDD